MRKKKSHPANGLSKENCEDTKKWQRMKIGRLESIVQESLWKSTDLKCGEFHRRKKDRNVEEAVESPCSMICPTFQQFPFGGLLLVGIDGNTETAATERNTAVGGVRLCGRQIRMAEHPTGFWLGSSGADANEAKVFRCETAAPQGLCENLMQRAGASWRTIDSPIQSIVNTGCMKEAEDGRVPAMDRLRRFIEIQPQCAGRGSFAQSTQRLFKVQKFEIP